MSIPTEDQKHVVSVQGGSGSTHELTELKADSAASVNELREFLSQLKGRKPQEVIGIVSANLLVQSMVMALVIVVGLLATLTVGPYLVYGPPQPNKAPATMTNASLETARPPGGPPTEAALSGNTAERFADVPTSVVPDLKKGSEVMGLDEAKSADPSKNPLDSPDLDKLLDGLDP
jgi:hypothetical protein